MTKGDVPSLLEHTKGNSRVPSSQPRLQKLSGSAGQPSCHPVPSGLCEDCTDETGKYNGPKAWLSLLLVRRLKEGAHPCLTLHVVAELPARNSRLEVVYGQALRTGGQTWEALSTITRSCSETASAVPS